MIKLPNSTQLRFALRRMLRPASKLGKITLWFGGLAIVLQLWKWISHTPGGTMLSVWAVLITYVFVFCMALRGMRWARQKLMWRLRNRLILTYVFIGVIPIVLLISMVLLAGYIFAGQFATYIALADLDNELQHLGAVNNALAEQFRSLTVMGKLTPQLAAEVANSSDESLRQRTLTVIEGDKGFVIEPDGKITEVQFKLPETAKGGITRFVIDHGRMHLRTMKRVEAGSRHMIIVSNLPITSELLQRAAHVGSVGLYPPDQEIHTDQPAPLSSEKRPASAESATNSFAAPKSLAGKSSNSGPQDIEAGRVAPAAWRFDPEFRWWTPFNVIDWESGRELTGVIVVVTRPSMLYNVLFGSLNANRVIFIQVLAGIAVFFGLIELIALFIGVRLTRSMTKSVAELYAATQHVNRGDLTHRIEVKSHDQMAALEESFNSMTASLAGLIAEQKEKQRLEGELTIAHEVQELLFPRQITDLSTLEVHGVCRPARTVSGDYYDFIPLHDDRMVLAVGDISGKGISAALLMATVHAFVRAYSLEPELALAAVANAGGPSSGDLQLYYRGNGDRDSRLSPGMLMATLNYQLYRSTPEAKYATMFLGSYDSIARTLTYSNAGHLPPYVISGDGRLTQLDTSGTVVGLFDNMSYEESSIPMRPGDIFVAFSDGVTEPENEFGEFGEDRLVELIRLHRDQPLARISDVVTGAVADWIGGNEQPDDVTLVLARAR